MGKVYRFPCGCEWPILEENPPDGVVPLLDFDVENAPEDCPATWALLGRGETKGVFQLESPLGKQWTRKLKPENGEHISALGAILRPGCLKAVDENGVSMTEHYCLRKNRQEDTKPYHPAIDPILFPTYNVLAYQEQAMAIAQAVAGFNLQDADKLRKAIGKKLPEEMAKCRTMFIEGAKNAGIITEKMAEEVFGWIEKSQRYAFNKCAHASTRIRRPNGGGYSSSTEFTIEKMYRIRNDLDYAKATGHESLRRKWMRQGNYGKGLSMCDDGRIRPNTIVDIQYAGKREVYRVTLENGSSILVTGNHKFPTTSGEMTVTQMMRAGHDVFLYVCGQYEKGYPSQTERVRSISIECFDDVYDVTMEGPNHNFVVESGIVTCNSHSVCYGLTGYECAYIKAHFPIAFFTAWLSNAKNTSDPQQEIYELVNDAKLFNVTVEPPDIRTLEADFHTDRKVVKFGLASIKGIGESQIEKLKVAVKQTEQKIGKSLDDWSWNDFLFNLTPIISANVVTRLIEAGALRFNIARAKMLAEYKAWNALTDKEQSWVMENGPFDNIISALESLSLPRKTKVKISTRIPRKGKEAEVLELDREYYGLLEQGASELDELVVENRKKYDKLTKSKIDTVFSNGPHGGCSSEDRRNFVLSHIQILRNPPSPLTDSPAWIAYVEEELLGISLTCAKIDSCDISQVNVTCKEYISGRTGFLMFGVEVVEVREFLTKKGKNRGQQMAFLVVSDGTCVLDNVIAFSDVYNEFKHLLIPGNTIIFQGERDTKKDSNSLFVKKVWQAS